MAVKIRLKRMGKIRAPYYRIVVADSRTKRDGRALEEIGKYHPTEEPSLIEVNSDRARYWLGVGAQPTEQVMAILKITGDWQAFKGLPGAEGTLRTAAPKADKKLAFEAAAREAMSEPKDGATTARAKKSRPKAEEPKAPVADAPAVDAPAVEAPAVEAPAVEAPAVEAPAVEQPAAEEPAAEEPAAEQPAAEQPAAEQPAAEEAVAGEQA